MKKSSIKANIFCVLLALTFITGCKEEGCTDMNAINYNSTATKDDGSCVKCQKTTGDKGFKDVLIYDNNFSSIYYNQLVATVTFKQYSESYNDARCGTENCPLYYTVKNFVNKNMSINLSLNGNSGINFFLNTSLTIPPNQNTTEVKIIVSSSSNSCLPISQANLSAYTNSTIYYF